MAKNFTQNPAAGALTGAEILAMIQGGVDVKVLLSAILALAWDRDEHLGTQAIATIDGLQTALNLKAADADVVHDTGNETVAGVKTFSSSPVVPDASWAIATTSGLQTALDAIPSDANVVHKTGAETIAGVKTFSSSPVVPDGSWTIAKSTGLQTALDAKAADSTVVKLTGNQTIAGTKTFSSGPIVPDASFAIAKTSGLQSALDAKTPITATVNTVAASGTTQTLPDVTSALVHRITLTANCTFTFPTAAAGKRFTLVLVQDGTGSRLATWPASAKWPAATAPTLTVAAGSVDQFEFLCSDGSTWAGVVDGLDIR